MVAAPVTESTPLLKGATKLNTYEGVFVPTTLNVLSILMFLRFGFIIGQAGILGSLLLLAISYGINLLTTMSVSAIATNGVVKGGGAYFMLSRSLGPEFGGSIGVVFYIGQVLNAGLNISGFADPLLANFGQSEGIYARALPDTHWWSFLYQTLLLFICTAVCLLGPSLFARSSKLLFKILLVATISVPLSILFKSRFYDDEYDAWYTGPTWETTSSNLWPQFTKNAAGSDSDGRQTFSNLFGIFFSATAGILAGASMSGDLKAPSKSIPRGTLYGLLLTFALYAAVILAIGSSVGRDLLYRNVDVISNINVSPFLVMLGEFATSIFSALMGVIGAAKLLQAIARDNIVPLMGPFGRGVGSDDNPIKAILLTYLLTQATILLNVNQIAVYITMAFLTTFVVLNLACFLLEVAAAPNFRPSFRYFNARTAALGTGSCIAAMLVADAFAALEILLLGVLFFVLIHAYASPKPWGDVSQAIIYHQVRKYLLKLRQDHVKYWRPQILLFVDDPRSGWQLIRFCNYLKKGGLLILGHSIVVGDDFTNTVPEIDRQRSAWEKLREINHIKAFFQMSVDSTIVQGARNIYLGSGLGGMRPNIAVLGFYDEHETGQNREAINIETLPTDQCRKESHMTYQQWVNIIEDLLSLGSNVCVAKGFMDIDMPAHKPWFRAPWKRSSAISFQDSAYVDLYPIQMSAQLVDTEGRLSGLSINFDTYTLILQLGSILHSVKAWSVSHRLRIIAFVEHIAEVPRERSRITELLETLRIQATVLVFNLDTNNDAYDVIVRGHPDKTNMVNQALGKSRWWQRLCEARRNPTYQKQLFQLLKPSNSNQRAQYYVPGGDFHIRKRRTLSSLQQLGVSHSMQATRWHMKDLSHIYNSDSDESESDRDSTGSEPASDPAVEDENDENDEDPGPSFQEDTIGTGDLRREEEREEERQSNMIHGDSVKTPSRSESPMPTALDYESGLRFNVLPAKAQHMILNCLMRRVSSEATVIFSTLPAPALGTHKTEKGARDYHELLQLLCQGLPPTALVHAQSMTVTTSL